MKKSSESISCRRVAIKGILGVDPQWIYVDLGTSYPINHVVLQWETAYAKAYQIQVSDDASTWTTVFSEANSDGGTDDITFAAVTARYVRMYATQQATNWGYSLWEFRVFGVPTLEPIATFSVDQIDFGSIDVGAISDSVPLVLTNSGTGPLTIENISVSQGFLQTNNCSGFLEAGGSCNIDIQFVPTTAGSTSGSLTMTGNDSAGTHTVALSGAGVPLVGANEIYRMDLSAYPHNHALTREEAAELFNSPGILAAPQSLAFDAGLIQVENDPFGGTGKVLSIQFRGGTSMLGTSENPSGGQWKVGFGGETYDDVYMSVQLGVDGDWVSPRGMHLPFMSVEPFAATSTPDPDTWASFFQLAGNNSYVNSVTTPLELNTVDDAISLYYYTMTKAQKYAWLNTANPFQWESQYLLSSEQVTLARNSYVTLEQRLRLNSVPTYDNPESDGLQQAWANGEMAMDRQNGVAWRRDASQRIELAWILFWTGGPDEPAWYQPQDQKIYMKSLVISTEPITH